MCSQYLQKYDDFIGAYEKLYHMKSNDSIEELINLFTSILLDKYKIDCNKLVIALTMAGKYNYKSLKLYVKIINHFLAKYSLKYKDLPSYTISWPLYCPNDSANENRIRIKKIHSLLRMKSIM